MPEVFRYVVTQVREVVVDAHNASDAGRIAAMAFKNGQHSNNAIILKDADFGKLTGVFGNTTSPIQEISLKTEKVR